MAKTNELTLDPTLIRQDIRTLTEALCAAACLQANDILVLGCSTSEITGHKIGRGSSAEMGNLLIEEMLRCLRSRQVFLAVQGCEHINRALVIERAALQYYPLEVVSVVPKLHAGGACAQAAYQRAECPVMVEHLTAQAGLDIGDTEIGMHVKFVQIPWRPTIQMIGHARVTGLTSRPKLIGGSRAVYSPTGASASTAATPL